MSQNRRRNPRYSESFKREVVNRIERGELTVLEASHEYGIGGSMTVYRWLDKYGSSFSAGPSESDNFSSIETVSSLKSEVASLKRLLEVERLRSESYLHMIKLAEEELGISIEKKSGAKRSK